MGIVILVFITLLAATAWHYYLPRYLAASIAAAVTSMVLFQLGAYVTQGHLDPFFPIAVVTSSLVALVLSLLIGLPLRARRKQQGAKSAL